MNSGQNNNCINNGINTVALARPLRRALTQPHPHVDAGLAANLGATFPSANLGPRSVVEPPPDPVRCLTGGSPLRRLPQGRGRLAVYGDLRQDEVEGWRWVQRHSVLFSGRHYLALYLPFIGHWGKRMRPTSVWFNHRVRGEIRTSVAPVLHLVARRIPYSLLHTHHD